MNHWTNTLDTWDQQTFDINDMYSSSITLNNKKCPLSFFPLFLLSRMSPVNQLFIYFPHGHPYTYNYTASIAVSVNQIKIACSQKFYQLPPEAFSIGCKHDTPFGIIHTISVVLPNAETKVDRRYRSNHVFRSTRPTRYSH